MIHLWSLILGGIGFISFYFISDHTYLILSFALIGISWGSILSMPYAMLSSSVDPNKMGVFMGIFNIFIFNTLLNHTQNLIYKVRREY